MKYIFIIFSLFLCTYSALGQIKAAGFHNVDLTEKLCARIEQRNLSMEKTSKMMAEILSVVNLRYNGKILECPNFGGKVLAFIDDGERWIAYDSDLMEKATENGSWAVKGILAHELAHHLYAHTLYDPRNLRMLRFEELDADNWAGFVLRKLGASKEEALQFLDQVDHPTCEHAEYVTHPCLEKRREATIAGWEKDKSTVIIRDTNFVAIDTTIIDTTIIFIDSTFVTIDTTIIEIDTTFVINNNIIIDSTFVINDTIVIDTIIYNSEIVYDTTIIKTDTTIIYNDRDQDGLSNEIDNCPDEAGPKETFGCPLPVEDDMMTSLSSTMVFVKGGSFRMGCTKNKNGICDDDEFPIQEVTIDDFYINKYEVTNSQWTHIMGKNPSAFKDCVACPVEGVNLKNIQSFIEKLNSQTGREYRLPTEAEWEYAARGGQLSNRYIYSGSNNLNEVAWYDQNSDESTHPVGTKMPNELGIYDMSGNVQEWCSDFYGDYIDKPLVNPKGAGYNGKANLSRGGHWYKDSSFCRVSDRVKASGKEKLQYLGLRLVATKMN